MGTNYYLNDGNKPHCASCTCHSRIHIGKASAGWCFSLHVIPERGLNSLDDWKRAWSADGCVIVDEYGSEISPAEMEDIICNRKRRETVCPPGYLDWAHFHAINFSESGPNGLVRHQIGRHCIGHGDGAYDLMPGEFS